MNVQSKVKVLATLGVDEIEVHGGAFKPNNLSEFTACAVLTEAPQSKFVHRVGHAILGIACEIDELLSAKSITNIMEEVGDILWFGALLNDCDPTILGNSWEGGDHSKAMVQLQRGSDVSLHNVSEVLAEISHTQSQLRDLSRYLIHIAKAVTFYGKLADDGINQDLINYAQSAISLSVKYLALQSRPDLPWVWQNENGCNRIILPYILHANQRKLAKRYPSNVWTELAAFNRNTDAELAALEGTELSGGQDGQ